MGFNYLNFEGGNKKMRLTFMISLNIALCLILLGCGKGKDFQEANSNEENHIVMSDVDNQYSSKFSEPLDASDETPKSDEIPELISSSDKISQTLDSLNQGLSQFMKIKYDNEVFQMNPLPDSSMAPMLEEVANNPKTNSSELQSFAESLEGFVLEMEQNLGEGYSLELLNPYNNRGSFFIMRDKKIEYPVLTDES